MDAATAYCRPPRYPRVLDSAIVPAPETWYYNDLLTGPTFYRSSAGKARQWTATCEKKVRRRR